MIERYGNTSLAVALIICAILVSASSAWPQAWLRLPPPATAPTPDLFVPHFVTPERGYLGGEISGSGVLYLTTDAGTSWRRVALPGAPGAINDIHFPNGSVGVAAGDGSYVAISTDGGDSWVERSVPPAVWPNRGDIQGVHFKDAGTGFVVGRGVTGSGYRMARTSTGGRSWINVPMTGSQNNLYDIDFFDQDHGVVVGTGNPPRKSVTGDGGITWEPDATMGAATPPSLSFYDVDAIAGTTVAVAAGGMVVNSPNYPEVRTSTDGGTTWHRTAAQPGGNKPLRGIIALTNEIFYAAGNGGTVHRTLDGGATWTQQTMPPGVTRDLRRFHRTSDGNLYLVGYGGTLLRLQLPSNAVFPQTSLNFGKLCPAGLHTVNLPIGNNGTSPLVIDSITIQQPAQPGVIFSVITRPTSIAPGETATVILQADVAPRTPPGLYSGSIRVYNNDENRTGADRDKLIPVAATITTKTLRVEDKPITYAGGTGVGTTISYSIPDLLTASGECPVTIREIYLVEGTDFELVSPLPTSLASGQKGTVNLRFTPRQPCRRYDTLVIAHDALSPDPDSLIRIPLEGTGLLGALQTAPDDTVQFGSVVIGGSATANLALFNTGRPDSCLLTTNITAFRITGPNPADFSTTFSIPSGGKVPILPGGSLTIPLNAAPTAPGIRIAYAVVTTDIPNSRPDTVVLKVKGLEPALTTTNTEIRFTITDVGGRRDSTIRDFLANLSSVTTQITGIRVIGTHASDFLYVGPNPTVVMPSKSRESIYVAFTPTAPGLRTATLELTTFGSSEKITVTLLGNATRAVGGVRNPVVLFPLTPINICRDTLLRGFIYNSGQVPLRITSTRLIEHPSGTPADLGAFTYLSPVVPPQRVIQPGDSQLIELRFCPNEPRPYYARLLLGTNTGAEAFAVDLIGTGRNGNLTLPGELVFPKTRVLTDRDTAVSRFLVNSGADLIRVDSVTITGADASSFTYLAPSIPADIGAGRDTVVSIRFNPKRRGVHRGTLNVYTSGPPGRNDLQSVRLEGMGIYPFLEITPADQQAHRTRINTTRRLTILIRNLQDGSSDTARIEDAVLAGSGAFANASGGVFPVTLPPGASVPVEVDFTPDRICEHTVLLTLRGEGVRGIYGMADTTVTVTGFGTAPVVRSLAPEIQFGLRPIGTPADSTLPQFLGNTDFTGALQQCIDSTWIDSILIAGPDAASFTLLAPADPLAPRPLGAGQFQSFSVRFQPLSPGLKSARLLVYFGGVRDSVHAIELAGAGSSVAVEYGPFPNMASIDFATVPLGRTYDSLLTLLNISPDPIVVDELRSTLPDRFIVTSAATPFTLLPGESDTVRIRFAPGAVPGPHTGALVVRSGALADSSFILRGVGVASVFRAETDLVDFGLHPPGSIADTTVLLLNETTPGFPDPAFLDSIAIDTVTIMAGQEWYQAVSYPKVVPVGGRARLVLRFLPEGFRASHSGIARVRYRNYRSKVPSRDSFDIALRGIVDGPTFDVGISLGENRTVTPGDTIRIPIILSGSIADADFDSLAMTLRFRRTMLKPLEIIPQRSDLQGSMVLPDPAPGTGGTAALRLVMPKGEAGPLLYDLVALVLLPDTLESILALDSIAVPGRPDILFTADSIRLMTTEFCDAAGRIIRFDTLLSFASKPNPASRATVFEFSLPAAVQARLSIYDAAGAEVMRLAEGLYQPGGYTIPFDASALASGSYYCVLSAGRFSKTLILRVLE